jgi:zinc transport system substrate-binding protein
LALAQQAQVIFGVGLGLEEGTLEFLSRTAPKGQVIVTFADLVGIAADGHSHPHTHAEGEVCPAVDGLNPHLWLDPSQCIRFVEAAGGVLSTRAGNDAARAMIEERVLAMVARIVAVDEAYETALAPFAGRAVLTQHAAFGPMLERYGLREVAIVRAGGEVSPTPEEVAAAMRTVAEQSVAAVFIEPQMSDVFARRIAAEGGLALGTLDPLGSGDWEAMMRSNLAELVKALGASRGDAP